MVVTLRRPPSVGPHLLGYWGSFWISENIFLMDLARKGMRVLMGTLKGCLPRRQSSQWTLWVWSSAESVSSLHLLLLSAEGETPYEYSLVARNTQGCGAVFISEAFFTKEGSGFAFFGERECV